MQLQMQRHRKHPKFLPLLLLMWLNAFSLGNQTHNSQLLLACPTNLWSVTKGVELKVEVFTSWGNQQQAQHPMEIAHIIFPRQNRGWCKREINVNCCLRCGHAHEACGGSPTLQSGGQNQKWPTQRADWLHNPCWSSFITRCDACCHTLSLTYWASSWSALRAFTAFRPAIFHSCIDPCLTV